jgi:hypothetical protein
VLLLLQLDALRAARDVDVVAAGIGFPADGDDTPTPAPTPAGLMDEEVFAGLDEGLHTRPWLWRPISGWCWRTRADFAAASEVLAVAR